MNEFGSGGNIGAQRANFRAGMTGLLLAMVLVMLVISASAQDDSTPAVDTVGPISGAQTLWSIANESRPDRRANINQFMLAFVERNPDAFILGNINLMQEGVILEVPTVEEALRIPVAEAQRRVDEQMREFSELSRAELVALRQTARVPSPEPEITVEIDPEIVEVEPEVVEAPVSELREDPVPEPAQDSVPDVTEEIAPEAMPPVEELEVVDEAVAVEFRDPEPLVDPEIEEQLVIETQAVDELDPEVEDFVTAAEDRPEGILPESPEQVETGPGFESEWLAEGQPLVTTEPVVQDEPFQPRPRPDTRLPEPEPVMDVGVSESVMDPGVGSSGLSDDLGRVAILGTLLIGLLILLWVWKQRSRDGQAVPADDLPDTPLVGDDDWNQSGLTERRSEEAIDDPPQSDYDATVIRSVGEGASDDSEPSEDAPVADAVKSEEEPLDIDALFKDEIDDGDDERVDADALFDLADDRDEEEPKTVIIPGYGETELTTDPDPDLDLDSDPDPELELDLELDPDPDPELNLDLDRELADDQANEQAEDLEELEEFKELNLTGLDDDQEAPQPAPSADDQAKIPAVGEADQPADTLAPEAEQPDAEEVSSEEFDFEWLKSGDEEDSESSSDGLVDQAGRDETASLDERDANKGSDQPEAVVDEPVDEAAETDEGGEDWDDMMARDLNALVAEDSEPDVDVDEDDTGGPEERGGPAESEPEAEAEQPPAAVDEQQQESAEQPVLSDKEAEVMIDLAEIYISSGDQQSAQELLKEIMRDGSGTMSARAQALQEKLD